MQTPKFSAKTTLSVSAIALTLIWSLAQAVSSDSKADVELSELILQPEKVHIQTTKVIVRRLKDHYGQVLDDELSSQLLDNYLERLDPNRLYFLQTDINEFEQWRDELDDQLKKGDLSANFFIYNRYRERTDAALQHLMSLLDGGLKNINLKDDEFIEIDRAEAAWPQNIEEAQTLGRLRLENAVLGMYLDNEPDDRILERLTKRYKSQLSRIEQDTAEDVFQLYINSFTELYDPHTTYFTPDQSENFYINMSRSLEGIGAVLQSEDEYTKVVRLVPGGPAGKSGKIKPGDRIIGVAQGDEDLVNIIGMRLDEVVDMIRGPKGSTVRLEIQSSTAAAAGAKEIELVRNKVVLEDQLAKSDIIEVPFESETMKIGVITIPDFYLDFKANPIKSDDFRSVAQDVKRLLLEIQREQIDGLILDLRDNGGGSLDEAINIVSYFINSGPVVQVLDQNGDLKRYNDRIPGTFYNGPMTVLVNRLSASASEIFAGAMQDYGRALIIGDQTFGKGTVQALQKLTEGPDSIRLFKITQSKFYRVSGGSNQHKGIIPDLSFPFVINKEEVGESALPHALPWDQIRAARFSVADSLHDISIETLKKNHDNRVEADPEFDYVRSQLALLEQQREKTQLSLNLETRRKELDALQEQSLEIENKRRASRGDKPLKSVKAMLAEQEEMVNARIAGEELDLPDPYLNETGLIMADMIKLIRERQRIATTNP